MKEFIKKYKIIDPTDLCSIEDILELTKPIREKCVELYPDGNGLSARALELEFSKILHELLKEKL